MCACVHRAQDVLVTLLNNLKVQERQNRVCTTVAIAIVAETCSPFTVLPALMNEYKVKIPAVSLTLPTYPSFLLHQFAVAASLVPAKVNSVSLYGRLG